ncbi:MAG: type II secretion system F family protein [Acidobacteriota bacterium]
MSTIDVLLAIVLVTSIVVLLVLARGGERAGSFASRARQAGLDPQRFRAPYWIAKILLVLFLALLVATWTRSFANAFVLCAGILGFLLPDLWLLQRRRARHARILQSLSFFLDLLVSLLHSGLSLDEAFRRCGENGLPAGHPLQDEARLVSGEIAAGKDRSQAFAALATRTKVADLHAFASALALGSRLGFPLTDILSTQADIQRERRVERGRKRIDRAMVLALVPVLLCGFPLFFAVVVMPVLLEVFKTLNLVRILGG